MECLLISGYSHTGKSTALIRLGNFLVSNNGYTVIAGDPIPPLGTRTEFRSLLDNNNRKRRVLLNTASDYIINGKELADFYSQHSNIDVIVSTIRDAGLERTAIFDVIQQLNAQSIVEVPMAKISGNRGDFGTAIADYWNRIAQLVRFMVAGPPFNL